MHSEPTPFRRGSWTEVGLPPDLFEDDGRVPRDFAAEFAALYNDPTEQPVITTRLQWWFVMAAIQLASRHPAARHSDTLKNAVAFARQLQTCIATPALARVAEQGWDLTLDE